MVLSTKEHSSHFQEKMPAKKNTHRSRYEDLRNRERALLVKNSVISSLATTAGNYCCYYFYFDDMFGTSENRVLYWMRKYFDSSFHPNTHGGARFFKFSPTMRNLIRVVLWDLLQRFSLGNIPFFQKELCKLGLNVDYYDVRTIFQRWNWS
jgi:hypothetical protein